MTLKELCDSLQALLKDHPELADNMAAMYSYDPKTGKRMTTGDNETVLVPIEGYESINLTNVKKEGLGLLVFKNEPDNPEEPGKPEEPDKPAA